jgi:hypothetical protein
MEFRLVTDAEIDKLRHLNGPADTIRRKIVTLIGELANMFNGDDPGGVSGLEFSSGGDSRVVGNIKTSFGLGRMRLEWIQKDDQLLGKIVIDREIFDQRDRQYWEPVYNFLMADSGPWKPSNPTSVIPEYLKRDAPTRYYGLGCSIFYAILNGPVVA